MQFRGNSSNHGVNHNNPFFAKGELDWFDFESRVRKIIYDLLIPVNTKMKEVKESNEISTRQVNTLDKLISDFKFKMKHYDSRIKTIEEIGRRIQKVEEESIVLEQKAQSLIKNSIFMQDTVKAFQGAMNQQVQMLEKTFSKSNFYDHMNSLLDATKSDIMKELETIQNDCNHRE